MEFGMSSNSLPTSRRFSEVNGDPSTTYPDDTVLQIVVEPTDSTPTLSRESTPVGANESSIKQELYTYARSNEWHRAKSIYDKFPDMVRILLTTQGDTALHVAVNKKSTTFVEELVKLMTHQDLEIQNKHGNTAFCMAVIARNDYFCQIMMERNENLPLIHSTQDGMLPVHLAILSDYRKMLKDLSSENLLQKMAFEDIERLFFMTIDNGRMYDVATKLLEKYPEQLVVARYDINRQTAFHLLAQKSSSTPAVFDKLLENNAEEDWGHDRQSTLLKTMCSQLQARQLEYNKIMELMTHPSIVLIDAIKSRNCQVVKQLLHMNPKLMTVNDPVNGRNLLHYAFLYREKNIIDYVLVEMLIPYRSQIYCAVRAVDNDRNNVLHLAAHQSPSEKISFSARISELSWFEMCKGKVPPELVTMRNNNGKTPKDIFNAKRRELSREVKEEAKGIANSGMVVAALVATVAFAAALTVPGDKTSPAFVIFILANAAALFTSSASIVSFLSIFTSLQFTTTESFRSSPNAKFELGLTLLFISIAAMVIAFAAASFLIFDTHRSYKWVAYLVAIMGFLPILAFLALVSRFFEILQSYFFRYCIPKTVLISYAGKIKDLCKRLVSRCP